jgi:hypothetical protein
MNNPRPYDKKTNKNPRPYDKQKIKGYMLENTK